MLYSHCIPHRAVSPRWTPPVRQQTGQRYLLVVAAAVFIHPFTRLTTCDSSTQRNAQPQPLECSIKMRRHLSNARPCQTANGNAASSIPFGRETATLLVLGLLLLMHADVDAAAASAAAVTTTTDDVAKMEHTVTHIGDARTVNVDGKSGIAVDNIVVDIDDDDDAVNSNNTSSQPRLKPSLSAESASSSSSSSAGSTTSSASSSSSTDGAQPQHIPLVRLPSNTLLKYSAYKDVSILHFRIPVDTRTALFSFKAFDESKSVFRKYSNRPSTIYVYTSRMPTQTNINPSRFYTA